MEPISKQKTYAKKQENCINERIENEKEQIKIIKQMNDLLCSDGQYDHLTEINNLEIKHLVKSITKLETVSEIFKFAQV